MSWTDMMTPWSAEPPPVPDPEMRVLALAALALAAVDCRETVDCHDCGPARLCDTHAELRSLAGRYEAVYMRIRGIGSDGAMLTLTGGLR